MASFVECGIVLLKACSHEEMKLFAMMIWVIWFEYCKYTHDNPRSNFVLKIDWAFPLLEEYQRACLWGKVRNRYVLETTSI